MAEEELLVTLCRGDSGSGGSFGFSLLGASASAGLPAAHVIYDIVENSPAARSGKVNRGTDGRDVRSERFLRRIDFRLYHYVREVDLSDDLKQFFDLRLRIFLNIFLIISRAIAEGR